MVPGESAVCDVECHGRCVQQAQPAAVAAGQVVYKLDAQQLHRCIVAQWALEVHTPTRLSGVVTCRKAEQQGEGRNVFVRLHIT